MFVFNLNCNCDTKKYNLDTKNSILIVLYLMTVHSSIRNGHSS